MCVHGGISPDIYMAEDIENNCNRRDEVPQYGMACDIVWSDPVDDNVGYVPGSYKYNATRGCSYVFGYQASSEF